MSVTLRAAIDELRARAARLTAAADMIEALLDPAEPAAPAEPEIRMPRRGCPRLAALPAPDKPAEPAAEKPAAKAHDGEAWTEAEDAKMRALRARGCTWKETAVALGRTEGSVIQRDLVLRRRDEKERGA